MFLAKKPSWGHHELLQNAAIKHRAVTESAESTQRPARSSSKHWLLTVLTLLITSTRPAWEGRALGVPETVK